MTHEHDDWYAAMLMKCEHHGWEAVMRIEHEQLAQRADGKLARMIGHALPGESQAELDRMARADQRRAQAGLVELRSGDRVWWKYIDDLTIEDEPFRLDAERALIAWLRARQTHRAST